MAILIGGILAVVVGTVWGAIWWPQLLSFLAAIIPTFLVVGGAIAIYFGIDEIRYPPPKTPPTYEPEKEESKAETTHGSQQPVEGESKTGG